MENSWWDQYSDWITNQIGGIQPALEQGWGDIGSVVHDQYAPWVTRQAQGAGQNIEGMAQQMGLTPVVQPTPEWGPRFDPSMVSNPGLQTGPPPMGPMQQSSPIGPGGVQNQIMDQQPPVDGQMAPNVHGDGPFPYTPPDWSRGPGDSFQPQGGLAGAGMQGGPSPMQSWLTDYNQQTDDLVAAQQEQARNAMWIQMGQALLANIGDLPMGMAGMGQAAAQYGANKPQMEEYRQGRESDRMDLLYKMERIRKSQQDPVETQRNVQTIRLSDNSIVEVLGNDRYRYNDGIWNLDELNDITQGAYQASVATKQNVEADESDRKREAGIQSIMDNMEVDRTAAAAMYDGPAGETLTSGVSPGRVEVISPDAGAYKKRAEAIREDLRGIYEATKDPGALELMEWEDEDLVRKWDTDR